MLYNVGTEIVETIDMLVSRLLGNNSGGGYNPRKVRSLKRLAESAFCSYFIREIQNPNFNIVEAFIEQITTVYEKERDYVDFLGIFLKKFIREREKVVNSDSDSNSDEEFEDLDGYVSTIDSDSEGDDF